MTVSTLEYYEHHVEDFHVLYKGYYSSIESFKDLISKSDIRRYLYHRLKYGSQIAEDGIIAVDLSPSEVDQLQLDIEIDDRGMVTFVLPTLMVNVNRIDIIPEVAIPGKPYQPAKKEKTILETRKITRKEGSWRGGYLIKEVIELDRVPEQR